MKCSNFSVKLMSVTWGKYLEWCWLQHLSQIQTPLEISFHSCSSKVCFSYEHFILDKKLHCRTHRKLLQPTQTAETTFLPPGSPLSDPCKDFSFPYCYQTFYFTNRDNSKFVTKRPPAFLTDGAQRVNVKKCDPCCLAEVYSLLSFHKLFDYFTIIIWLSLQVLLNQL